MSVRNCINETGWQIKKQKDKKRNKETKYHHLQEFDRLFRNSIGDMRTPH